MAKNADLWLPEKFLSGADEPHQSFKLFPTEFPYEVDSSSANSSVLSSPAEGSTESDSSSSDEDEFFAALTRRFAQTTKPKVTSPPETPFAGEKDTWKLIYAAAGQVARLKMVSAQAGRGLLCNPNAHPQNNFVQFGAVNPPVPCQQMVRQGQMGHFHQIQHQSRPRTAAVCCGSRSLNLAQVQAQAGWAPVTRPGMGNAPGVKRECAGTGVFLPRRYSNPPEPRKKPTGCPNVVLPAKVVQALNLSFEDMNIAHSHHRFGCGFAPDYEAIMARRNYLLEQQRRSLRAEGTTINHEVRLPQEWTY